MEHSNYSRGGKSEGIWFDMESELLFPTCDFKGSEVFGCTRGKADWEDTKHEMGEEVMRGGEAVWVMR